MCLRGWRASGNKLLRILPFVKMRGIVGRRRKTIYFETRGRRITGTVPVIHWVIIEFDGLCVNDKTNGSMGTVLFGPLTPRRYHIVIPCFDSIINAYPGQRVEPGDGSSFHDFFNGLEPSLLTHLFGNNFGK